MKNYVTITFFYNTAVSQPKNGTTGLLNVPSVEMQADGTFFMGANYAPVKFGQSDHPVLIQTGHMLPN